MGIVIGVVVGYALGTRAGEEGWEELVDAVKVISSSAEVRDLLASGLAISRDLVGRGSELLSGRLATSGGTSLRPAA